MIVTIQKLDTETVVQKDDRRPELSDSCATGARDKKALSLSIVLFHLLHTQKLRPLDLASFRTHLYTWINQSLLCTREARTRTYIAINIHTNNVTGARPWVWVIKICQIWPLILYYLPYGFYDMFIRRILLISKNRFRKDWADYTERGFIRDWQFFTDYKAKIMTIRTYLRF